MMEVTRSFLKENGGDKIMRTYKVKEISFIKGDDEYNNMKIKSIFKYIEEHEKEGWTFEKITASYNPCGFLNIFIHFTKEEEIDEFIY